MSPVTPPVIATRRGIAVTALLALGVLGVLAATESTVVERTVILVPVVGLLLFSIALNTYRARHGAELAESAWLRDTGEAAGARGEGGTEEAVDADPRPGDAHADTVVNS